MPLIELEPHTLAWGFDIQKRYICAVCHEMLFLCRDVDVDPNYYDVVCLEEVNGDVHIGRILVVLLGAD